MMVRRHLFISGRVQGVLFRASMQMRAKIFGVNGFVKNLLNGKVEAVLEGEDSKVQRLINWSEKGPFFSRVDDIEVIEESYRDEFNKFKILI